MIKQSSPQQNFNIDRADAAMLRRVAFKLGMAITRGPGTGHLGNVAALNRALAAAARIDFDRTIAALQSVIRADAADRN
jgi:hypothetical protein